MFRTLGMKGNYIGICIMLSVMTLAASCVDEIERVDVSSVKSKDIIFGGVMTDDIIVTRSGDGGPVKVVESRVSSESGDISLPVIIEVEKGIRSVCSNGPATRASITRDMNDIERLDAWAIYTKFTDATQSEFQDRYLYFDENKVGGAALSFSKNETDGIFYSDNKAYPWPGDPTAIFNFVTVAPVNSGFQARLNTLNNIVSFDYTVPADASLHKDILVASPDMIQTDFRKPVPLTFKHVMAAVNVKVGAVPDGMITSVKFRGVYNKASYYPDGDGWVNRTIADGGEFSVDLPAGGVPVGTQTNGTLLTSGEAGFMMIPQQLFTGAELEVGFHDNTTNKDVTLRASIQGDVWEMNTTTNYLINIDANYNISIVPLDKVLDSHYIITKVEVSSEFPNWVLTASANDGASVTVQHESDVNPMAKQGFWTDKIASRDGNGNYYVPTNAESARGEDRCRGVQGEGQIVYVFIPENVSGETRTITLSIVGSGAGTGTKTLTLTQEPVVWLDPTGAGETYWGCELLLEGGQVPWGFCWDGITEEYITTQGNQISVPQGQLKHVTERLEAAGFDVNQMYDPNFYINLVQRSNNNQGWLLQIDYSRIGNIEVADEPFDGETNTKDLYYFDGISTLAALKEFIANQDNIQYTMDSGEVEITNTLDFAAMYAIKRNRFHLYDDGQGLLIPVIEEKDINWYLPAKDQFPVFMDTNWGQQFSFNDLFWTSTAYLTDTETDNAHSYAYLNGMETISHRNDPYLTFALRRYTVTSDVQIPINPEDVIKPGDDISGGGTGGEGGGNTGGDVEGNT